jgi:hypothetical protein
MGIWVMPRRRGLEDPSTSQSEDETIPCLMATASGLQYVRVLLRHDISVKDAPLVRVIAKGSIPFAGLHRGMSPGQWPNRLTQCSKTSLIS